MDNNQNRQETKVDIPPANNFIVTNNPIGAAKPTNQPVAPSSAIFSPYQQDQHRPPQGLPNQVNYQAPPPQPYQEAPQAQPNMLSYNMGPDTRAVGDEPRGERNCLDRIPILKGDTERHGFVIKVYTLLFIQITITAAFVAAGFASAKFREFMHATMWLYVIAYIGTAIIILSQAYFYSFFRKFPINYILLFIFTLCESYTVATITAFYDSTSVLIATFLTLGMTLSLSIFACLTKRDYTTWYRGLMWVFIGTLLIFIVLILIYPSRYVSLIIGSIVVVLVSVYLIVDTQMILGGRKYSIGYDDYVLGVILLYTDIITMFLYILAFFGRRD